MNMMGNAGGAVTPMIVPLVLTMTHNNWHANFWVFAGIYLLGALCWVFLDPVTSLETEMEVTA
jgi:nitrate/nitrite transporter NarK